MVTGVTVMVAVTGALLLLTAVKEGTLPVLDSDKPIDVLELSQCTTLPGLLIKLYTGNTAPSNTEVSALTVTDGTAFTSSVNVVLFAH